MLRSDVADFSAASQPDDNNERRRRGKQPIPTAFSPVPLWRPVQTRPFGLFTAPFPGALRLFYGCAQCLKLRWPVKTIVAPDSLQASID